MKKKTVFIAVTAVCIIAAAVIFYCVFFRSAGGELHTARITSDGKVVRTIDLHTAQDETFVIESENGSNTVCISNGEISVTEASCPDRICVEHGALRSEYLPIICLPNRLVIELV